MLAPHQRKARSKTPQQSDGGSGVSIPFRAHDDVYIINATDFGSDILAIRYASDGKLITVGTATGELLMVRPNTHQILATYQTTSKDQKSSARGAAITCLREHPRSVPGAIYMLASFASGHIRCWNVNEGSLKFSLREPRQTLGLAVSSDVSTFISTGDDGILYVYDIVTCRPIIKLEPSPSQEKADGHYSRAFAAQYNPANSREAISGGWDDSIHFWDVRVKNSIRRTGPAHVCGSDAIDITSDGKEILTGSYRKNSQFQIWDYSTGQLWRTLDTDRHTSSLYAVAYLSESMVCSGGADPALFRTVHVSQKATTGLVTDMSGGVFSIHKGPIGVRYNARPKLNMGRERPDGKSGLPRVAFCAGKSLYEIELY